METWMVLSLEILGKAKRARVKHLLPDGSARIREYGWPATITRDEIVRTLDALHAQVVYGPAPSQIDEGFDLVGKPREG